MSARPREFSPKTGPEFQTRLHPSLLWRRGVSGDFLNLRSGGAALRRDVWRHRLVGWDARPHLVVNVLFNFGGDQSYVVLVGNCSRESFYCNSLTRLYLRIDNLGRARLFAFWQGIVSMVVMKFIGVICVGGVISRKSVIVGVEV